MDIFSSSTFVKYEIIFLGINLMYILFHILHSLFLWYLKIRNFFWKKKSAESIIEEQEAREKEKQISVMENETYNTDIWEKDDSGSTENKLSTDDKQYLVELIKNIKTRIARGEFHEARARIIEGLAIEKFNKDLNCLLAALYEKDRDYKKAELIYKDLIVMNDTDPELYLKLGFALSIQGKYEIAYEIYKRLLALDENNIETVDMLANLGHQLGLHRESNMYAQIFLKKNPHNTDMLYLVSINHINMEERLPGLDALKKIRAIDPYNSKIQDLIKKVELELEMEKNFKIEE